MTKREFSTASREEIDVTLQLLEGELPNDLYGTVFINSACGTVNSGGLPFLPKNPDGSENQEYGSPLINGDALMFRIDFNKAGTAQLKTGLLKAPCYYADRATSPLVNPGNPWSHLKFENMGLARISMKLGTRDELNTAITPVKFDNDEQYRLLATFDAGRPFEFDPAQLKLITAIGENKIWHSGLPPFLYQPLAMVLTTAHPVFDPVTQEMFTVNFTKTTEQLMSATHIFEVMFHDADWFKEEFKKLIDALKHHPHKKKIEHTKKWLDTAHLKSPKKNKSIFHKAWNWLKHKISNFYYKVISNKNSVKLLRWNGKVKLDEWTIVNENGDPIAINYNMHQLGFSEDYVILCDTNFKFTLDVMINFPFQNDATIDKFIRELLSGAMDDFSTMYLVKRSDLKPGVQTVKATATRLPVETVHFSANYKNPNDVVTIHTAHNCSACPAEWLRSYDELKVTPKVPVDRQKIGLIAIGEMDIGKIGRLAINGSTGKLEEPETFFLHLTGENNGKIDQAHTWAIGLYTYNGMLSPDQNVDEIEHIYWQSYGLSDDRLTSYIYDLYKDPKRNRIFSGEDMVKYTKMGAQFVLQCVETKGMTATDFYTFDKDQYYWSIQFVPRKGSKPGTPESKNGYILTTVITGSPFGDGELTYSCEIWLFDAMNLGAGPVCKMAHPSLSFGFTIHSVWVPEASEVTAPPYVLDVESDYNYMIDKVPKKGGFRKSVQALFDQEVYPNF